MNIKYVSFVDFLEGCFDQAVVAKINIDELDTYEKEIYDEWSELKSTNRMVTAKEVEIIFEIFDSNENGYKTKRELPRDIDFDKTELFNTEKKAIASFHRKLRDNMVIFFEGLFK